MRSRELFVALFLAGCGQAPGTTAQADLSTIGTAPTEDLGTSAPADLASAPPDLAPLPPNVVPIVVDDGPPAATYASYNVPFITVTLCAPGTSSCATLDHVAVDTGSVGLRVLSAALPPGFASALPTVTAGGSPMAECYTFADGFVWGPVRTVDLTIGGEHVSNLAFQLIGDASLPTVPKACKSTGPSEDTLDAFGANAIIGVGNYAPDCGSYCDDATQFGDGWQYYACATPGSCAQVTVSSAQQVQNPVSLLPVDNNGVLIQLPTIADTGAATPSGLLTFGIGTQSNNALGSATIFPIGDQNTDGSITVTMAGRSFSNGIFDSGTTDLSFDDTSLPACTGDFAAWDCPPMMLDFTAQNLDGASGMHAVSFHVDNAATLLGPGTETAFNDIASPAGDKTAFVWGLPFFYGRSVFTAIEGKSTPGGTGPYFAY